MMVSTSSFSVMKNKGTSDVVRDFQEVFSILKRGTSRDSLQNVVTTDDMQARGELSWKELLQDFEDPLCTPVLEEPVTSKVTISISLFLSVL